MRLKDYQDAAVEFLKEHPKCLLADDVGMGKTIVAIGYIRHLHAAGLLIGIGCRVLVVTESALLDQWEREIQAWLPDFTVGTTSHPRWKSQPAQKHLRSWDEQFAEGPDILVTTYSLIHNRLTEFSTYQPSLVILDEVSSLKGGGKEHASTVSLTRTVPRVVGLTATPVENHPMEAYNVLEAIGTPDLWPREVFSDEYVEWERWWNNATAGWESKPLDFKEHKLPEIHAYMHRNALRRTATGVGLELPKRYGPRLRWVPLTDRQERAYKAASGRTDARAASTAKEQAGRLSGRDSALVDELLRILQDINEKVIVYCETKALLTLVQERLDLAGIGHVRIDGDVHKSDRDDVIATFRDDADVQVLLGSKVLEYGLNLQFVRVLISLDVSWNPGREHQREGRMTRIGSPHTTYQHTALLPDTPQIKQRKRAVLERKGGLLGRLFGPRPQSFPPF